MSKINQAADFRARHGEPRLLILPNAWDACSAMLMHRLGAEAIATTSAGVAWALGYPDGDAVPIELHAACIRQIARVVSRPVSADVEGGYSDDPQQAAENILRLLDAGAVGINLEDGHGSPDALCRKIEAVKAAAARAGIDVFLNARTDVFLKNLAPDRPVEETLRRAIQYAAAGADGLFAPAVKCRDDIAALVTGQPLPLNVMAMPGLPPATELSTLGVRRLSAGSAIAQKVWGVAQATAAQFLSDGSTDSLFADASTFAGINAGFSKA